MSKNELLLLLYIQPNARHDKVMGLFNGEIKIQISAPAVDNKANLYLQKWLAKEFGVPKSAVMLKKGEHSRHKAFYIINPKLTPSWLELAN
jgi:uncharacterized protein (TIGR00251 family)